MGFKLLGRTMFPALVSTTSPLTLLKVGLAYTFGLDITALRASLDPLYLGISGPGEIIVASATGYGSTHADYVCNGTADEIEINAAITSANLSGKSVKILDGIYLVDSPVVMKSGVSLSGVNKFAALIRASSSFVTSSGIIHCGGISNFSIKNLGVDGRTNNKAANGIVCAPALLFSSGALTGTPCTNYEVSGCDLKVAKLHAYHSWNVRSQDFTVANNSMDGGYTSADAIGGGTFSQEGAECVGTKRGNIINNHITGIGNAALNFPSFTDLSVDMGFEDMIVEGNICKTVGNGILSYLYSNSITGDVGGMVRCRFANNVIDDWYINGIDFEVLNIANFGGPVPFQGNDICHNTVKGAAAGQPAASRGFNLSNGMALTDISSFSNSIIGNHIVNSLNTTAGFANFVSFSGFDFVRNIVRSPVQGSGNSAAVFAYGCADCMIDNNRFDGGRNQSIQVQGMTNFSICFNTCLNWNGSAGGFVGIQVEAGAIATTAGDVQGNRFKATTLTGIGNLVRFDATCDQINFNLPNNRYIGSGYTNNIVTTQGGLTFNNGAPLGYVAGAGGTVTQATSKATGVTLDKVSGAITMNAAALAAATIVSFVLTDSKIAATDVLILNHISGGTPGSYSLNARCAAGSATIDVRNNTAGSLSEAIVVQFGLIKAVNA